MISLPGAPIGVKLLQSAGELLDHPEARLLSSTSPCQMAAVARYGRGEGIVGASAQGTKCVWGAACLGLIGTPDRLAEGDLNRPFVRDEEAARRLHRGMHMLGSSGRRNGGLLMGPLDLLPAEPDVIVLYVTPGQALRLIIGLVHDTGEAITAKMTGQASLCSAIATVVEEGRATVDIPCLGDRTYGLVQDHELLVALPATMLGKLMEGLRATERVASYPCSPFLRWSAIYPPQFEPRSSELE